jgi:hypothetical protein
MVGWMEDPFVPLSFEAPDAYAWSKFHLEPLGKMHNDRDHAGTSAPYRNDHFDTKRPLIMPVMAAFPLAVSAGPKDSW